VLPCFETAPNIRRLLRICNTLHIALQHTATHCNIVSSYSGASLCGEEAEDQVSRQHPVPRRGGGGGVWRGERVGRGLVEENETTGKWIRETKSGKMDTRDQGW